MGSNMSLCKWHTFWIVPCVICYFIVILFILSKSDLLSETLGTVLATILPLISKLCGKFQHFDVTDGNIEMLKNTFHLKWKVVKHFTGQELLVALRKLFSLLAPHHIKAYYVARTKFFSPRYTEICRNLLSKRFENAVLGCLENDVVDFFFSDTKH